MSNCQKKKEQQQNKTNGNVETLVVLFIGSSNLSEVVISSEGLRRLLESMKRSRNDGSTIAKLSFINYIK